MSAALSLCAFGLCGCWPPLRVHRCGRCRHEYDEGAWQRLEVVERMVAARVRDLVTAWPDDVAIEIRRCGSCGGLIARKQGGRETSGASSA